MVSISTVMLGYSSWNASYIRCSVSSLPPEALKLQYVMVTGSDATSPPLVAGSVLAGVGSVPPPPQAERTISSERHAANMASALFFISHFLLESYFICSVDSRVVYL